jgi:hypothetical protein
MGGGPGVLGLDYFDTVDALSAAGQLSVRFGLVGVALGLARRVGSRRARGALWIGAAFLLPAAHGVCFLPFHDPFREFVVPVLGYVGCLLLMIAVGQAFRNLPTWWDIGGVVWCVACLLALAPFLDRFFRITPLYSGAQFAVAVLLAMLLDRHFCWRRSWDAVCRLGRLLYLLGAASVLAAALLELLTRPG